MIPFAGLLIGGTALQFRYGLAMSNVSHFQKISGLSVVPFREQRPLFLPGSNADGAVREKIGRKREYS